MSTISTEQLTQMFVDAADTLVEDFDLIEFLETMTVRVATVSGHTQVGLLLADHRGRLQFIAATQDSARLLELFVVQTRDGPCRECYTAGEVVIEPDLRRAHHRWPTFTPRAMAAGFRSVCAIPMRHRGKTIGAMSLFGALDEVLSAQDLTTVQGFADIATIGILQDRAARRKDLFAKQLQTAMDSRAAIEQAKGVLAQRGQTDIDTATTWLREYCRNKQLHLSHVARDIVSDPDSHPQLTRSLLERDQPGTE